MIELDVIAYLNDDASLTTLLGASGSDSKIYPIQKPINYTVPYIVYTISDEGTLDENLLYMTIEFDCAHSTYDSLLDISDRIYELLDVQDTIQSLMSSTDYFIYWSKIISGADSKDTDTDYYHKKLNVQIKYNRKVRW